LLFDLRGALRFFTIVLFLSKKIVYEISNITCITSLCVKMFVDNYHLIKPRLYSKKSLSFASVKERTDLFTKTNKDEETYSPLTIEELPAKKKEMKKELRKLFFRLGEPVNAIAVQFGKFNLNEYNIPVLELFLNKEKNNDFFAQENIIMYFINNVDNKSKGELANKLLMSKNLINNYSLRWNLSSILKQGDSEELSKSKLLVLNKMTESPELFKNSTLADNFGGVLAKIKSKDDANAKVDIMQFYLDKDCFNKNANLKENLLYMLQVVDSIDKANSLKSILNDENLSKKVINALGKKGTFTGLDNKYLKDVWQLYILNSQGSYILETKKLDNNSIFLSEEDFRYNSKFKAKATDYNIISTKKDVNNNCFFTEQKLDSDNLKLEQRQTYYNSDKERVTTKILRRSKLDNKEYEILVCDKGKKVSKNSTVKILGNDKIIEQNLKSPDGTVTKVKRTYNDKESSMNYQIVDKDGKVLTEINRKSEKIDINHKKTYLNGQGYDVKYFFEAMVVSKLDEQDNPVETFVLNFEKLDRRLFPIFRELAGDQLWIIGRLGLGSRITYKCSPKNACFDEKTRSVFLSKELFDKTYTYIHELGHAIDYLLYKLKDNQELKKIFNEELENYKNTTTYLEGTAVDYFTSLKHPNENNCLTEVIAEAYALISGTQNNFDLIMLRGPILQENFPKTISYIVNTFIQ